MLWRCYNPNRQDYPRYGGRGIRVCRRWKYSFVNFMNDMGVAPKGMQLGRIDNNLGYSKANCRWETPREQARNRSTNRFLTYGGVRATAVEWAEKMNLSYPAMKKRLENGWSAKRAILTPLRGS